MSSKSRTNGRPALAISTLPPLDLDLPATGSAWLICPECTHTVEVIRGLVQTHKPDGRRCAGSAQRLNFDLTPTQHAARRIAARELLRPENQRYLPTTAMPPRAANQPATPRSTVLGTGRRPTARRTATHTGQHSAERHVRTTMAAALEAAWERIGHIPVTPAHSAPDSAPHAAKSVGWSRRQFTETEMTYANTVMAAKRIPAAA